MRTVLGASMANVAITGANGYVGSRLARCFEKRGHVVFPMIRRLLSNTERHIPFDLNHAIPAIEFRKRNIEILIHCAYDFSPKSWSEIYTRNVKGSEALFLSAQEGGVKQLLFMSSQSAFPRCRSYYGHAKWEMERIAVRTGALIVRPGIVYGKNPGGMMGSLVESVSSRRLVPTIIHPGKSLHLVHEDDLCDLVFRLATGELPQPSRPVIAASAEGWSVGDIVRKLARQAGRSVLIIPVPWFLVWIVLVFLETLGVNVPFRSDSVLTLGYPNPDPEADAIRLPQIRFREFEEAQ